MKCYFLDMRHVFQKTILPALTVIGLLTTSTTVHADAAAEEILKAVRLGTTLQHGKLVGELRKDGKRTPMELTMEGETILFQFNHEKKWQGFSMKLKEGNAKLYQTANGKATVFPAKKIGESILGSDVTYEDLSLRFLYWKDATIVGEERIKLQDCYKLRLINPGKDGRYSIVNIWVSKKYGALMQVAGYDADGDTLKRFHITKLMTIEKVQTIEKMNVETYKKGSSKVIGISSLVFSKAKTKKRAERSGL